MNPSDVQLDLWPAAASASAVQTDHLIWAFTILTVLLVVPVFVGITIFAIVYREGRQVNRTHTEKRDRMLELGWMIIPFTLTLFFFVWGAQMYVNHRHPPPNATQIDAIGRQWMWQFQHPGGQAEINDLHVPTGKPILINMISQDVIHSLYIPAMRIQMETLPGRYTQIWFNADRPGVYHIFCSEFCGTDHSLMEGDLYVMTPSDYSDWLGKEHTIGTLAQEGQKLYAAYGCSGCHEPDSRRAHGPLLAGLYHSQVKLADGQNLVADTAYLRDKILNPDHNKLAAYKQVMPSFNGVIPEDEMVRLIAFIKADGQRKVQSP